MTVKQMHNVGIVVESLDTAICFFVELGLAGCGKTAYCDAKHSSLRRSYALAGGMSAAATRPRGG